MSGEWHPVAPRVSRVVLPVEIDPTGRAGPTRGRARGPGWRRTSHGLFVRADVAADCVEQRIAEQVARGGVATAASALRLHGANYFDRLDRPVDVVADGCRVCSDTNIRVSREPLSPDEVVVRHGVRVVRPERALFDELRGLADLRDAVVAADMTFAARLTSRSRMLAYVEQRRGWRRAARLVEVLVLSDEHSRSPREPRLRLVWQLDGGWRRPLVNATLTRPDGIFLGSPDLFDVERGVAVEYAGEVHRSAERHRRDVVREEGFRGAGVEVVTVVGGDLGDVPALVERLEAARGRGRGPGAWVVVPHRFDLDAHLDDLDRIRQLDEL